MQNGMLKLDIPKHSRTWDSLKSYVLLNILWTTARTTPCLMHQVLVCFYQNSFTSWRSKSHNIVSSKQAQISHTSLRKFSQIHPTNHNVTCFVLQTRLGSHHLHRPCLQQPTWHQNASKLIFTAQTWSTITLVGLRGRPSHFPWPIKGTHTYCCLD